MSRTKRELRAVPSAGEDSTIRTLWDWSTMEKKFRKSRRAFMQKVGGISAAARVSSTAAVGSLLAPLQARDDSNQRDTTAFNVRRSAAVADLALSAPPHVANSDEAQYPNRIGNFSKGLPHSGSGEVDAAAYDALRTALSTGRPQDFESIPLGGTVKLINPQAGLAFDLEGLDSHQFAQPASPALASAWRAGEAVEGYWMALLRDVGFTEYPTNSDALQAADELSRLSDFRGPKRGGAVTADTLFRGFTAEDLIGPYVSQFLLKPFAYGAISVEQKFKTYSARAYGGKDYLTDVQSWLAAQNGIASQEQNRTDPMLRYVRNGRDLAAYVHMDVLFQAYLNACLWLLGNHAPLNPGNPYNNSQNQTGFGTFGPPHFAALLAEVASRALKAVWYQKWFVHRALRPEEYGGLVHVTATRLAAYPLHPDVLNSTALAKTVATNGSYFLSQVFPEGCPQHPSYGAGHATVAGACVTILKAFFDETYVLPDPVVASSDGLSLVPYPGSDASQITVGGELNKIASNIGIGRNHAGVHWRSDYEESLRLGEAVAISILRDQVGCYNEPLTGASFTRFDRTRISI